MHISAIPMRWGSGDNYCYLLSDQSSKDSWIIDPAEPKDINNYLKTHNPSFNLKAIVNTHHHYDHSDGNAYFVEKYKDVPVIAGKDSPLVTHTPDHNSVIQLSLNISITALHTPCHTQDSICYFAHDKSTDEKAVFTGDTLFTSGCGRFFEGTPSQMNSLLNQVLAKLPKDTKVYPGHEYTKSNVKFSSRILDNVAMKNLSKFVDENEQTTGKFTIGDELEFNPFMRLDDPVVQRATGETDGDKVMGKLREMKNRG